jgi:hypothetical protein
MRIHSPSRPAGSPEEQVLEWRRRRLLDAGFGRDLAATLAAERRMDLHALLQLVERGCPPVLAARILAPPDGEWAGR